MKRNSNIDHRSFQYKFNDNKFMMVEFDILVENGKKAAKNITLTSNWRAYYPKNPEINLDSRGEYGFFEKGVFSTNGDIQQIIRRIQKIVEEPQD